MAGYLSGTNRHRFAAILACEFDVMRFLDVGHAERFPCCAHVIDILYDPRNLVH
jgi:hypothetical protein